MIERVVISIDAMGGDEGPITVIRGIHRVMARNARLHVLLHGDEDELNAILAKFPLVRARSTLCPTETIIGMEDTPAYALKHGRSSSMWAAIKAVADGRAGAAVSCGNTGALMAIATIILKRAANVRRPAIAIFWPAISETKFNVLLDAGADIRADTRDLKSLALMGAAYARAVFDLERPKVGLLNIGTETHKGLEEIKGAHEALPHLTKAANFDYVGYVEGNEIPKDKANVIVTDGFTGNIALKTAEGTAQIIGSLIRAAFANSLLSRLASVFALTSMRRLKRRIDPRRANGGVFLGLNGTVVKSHGSSDKIAFASALDLAIRLDRNNLCHAVSDALNAQTEEILT